MKPKVLILVPAHNQERALHRCLNSILEDSLAVNADVLVVDDGSATPLSQGIAAAFPFVQTIRIESQVGFTRAVNEGLNSLDEHSYVVLINSDMQVVPGCIDALVNCCLVSGAAIVGGMELSAENPNHVVCGGTRSVTTEGALRSICDFVVKASSVSEIPEQPFPQTWVPFGVVLITASCLQTIGCLDELFLNYFSDVDFCMRAEQQCFTVIFEPRAKVLHEQHLTSQLYRKRGILRFQMDRQAFVNKWFPAGLPFSREHTLITGAHPELSSLELIPHMHEGSPLRDICLPLLSNELRAELESFHKAEGYLENSTVSRLFSAGLLYHKIDSGSVSVTDYSLVGRTVLFVSPHADDVGLSAGGFLQYVCSQGASAEVHVIFGSSGFAVPPLDRLSVPDITLVRMFEDAMFSARMGALSKYHWLQDALLRNARDSFHLSDFESAPLGLVNDVANILEKEVSTSGASLAIGPLAAGGMIDHAIVFLAMIELLERGLPPESLMFYEDIPYVGRPSSRVESVGYLSRRGLFLESCSVDVSPWFERKTEELHIYFSQMTQALLSEVDVQGQAAMMHIPSAKPREPWRRAERMWRLRAK